MRDAKEVADGIVHDVLSDAQFDMCVEYVAERIERDRREAQLAVLGAGLERFRKVAPQFRDDLQPGIAMACVELERMIAELRSALAATPEAGKADDD